ncbi:MAG: hypothetical protein M1827_002732 [Pycnora praestabilis]|nr:MAG: hypothetical protein M1827_002732 [Pycnora praestabilis]
MIFKSQRYDLLDDQLEVVALPIVGGSTLNTMHGRKSAIVILMAFLLSLVLNVILIFQNTGVSDRGTSIGRTVYANLAPDTAVAWTSRSPYFGEGKTVADQYWEHISIDNGTIALSDAYVKAMDLPTSQRFPWDEKKGLYLLNGFHSMHCLVCRSMYRQRDLALVNLIKLQKTIRQWVLEYDRGLNQTEPTEHILHCLDALRQDVICYADDTPRYTGFQPSGRSGTGQIRQCKSWRRLEAWAQQHSACWRYIQPHNHTFNSLERHKFCPKGSPYISRVNEIFGGL